MKVFPGQLTLVCPCVGIHERTSLISSSLLHQLCPAGLVCLIWMICEMGGKWPYSGSFMGCCFQDLFKTARSILMLFSSNFFSMRFVQVVQPYSSSGITTAWKKSNFILSVNSDLHIIDNLSIAVHASPMCMLTLLSVDEILLRR